MTEFDPTMIIRGVCDENERIVNWLSRGSDRIERVEEIKLGPMPIGEKVRHVSRGEDLDELLGRAVVAGYKQAMKDFVTQQEGEQ